MNEVVPIEETLELFPAHPTRALERAEELVRYMADKCKGPQFVSSIRGKLYPKVEWWTTVGASLQLFPREVSSARLPTENNEVKYESIVEVCRGGDVISRASNLCSSAEPWGAGKPEHAIKSMATTRATSKAYRIGLSFLAVLAGLEPTPAEEMPRDEGIEPEQSQPDYRACPECGESAIIKGKAEYGGGWVCWKKRGGCGATFPEGHFPRPQKSAAFAKFHSYVLEVVKNQPGAWESAEQAYEWLFPVAVNRAKDRQIELTRWGDVWTLEDEGFFADLVPLLNEETDERLSAKEEPSIL